MADYSGDRLGQQLGKYRLIRLLGMGGFAEVYLGEHVSLGSQAAIKVLHTRLVDEDAEQFLQEARTIAHLSHPHIVRVLDYDVERGIPFIVMEYAHRGTLRRMHPKGQTQSLETIVSYTNQIASALQYAHNLKLIHRDVKPENMLVGKDGVILLSDFGIATNAHSSSSQRTEDIAGTMAYMSPEQIQGHPRPASDQYALAIAVYEWLSGGRPFVGTATELIAMHIQREPPSLRAKLPTLLPEIEEVVMIALSKDYKARFGSVEAFARALSNACQLAYNSLSKQTQPISVVVTPDQTVPIPTVLLSEERGTTPISEATLLGLSQKGKEVTPVTQVPGGPVGEGMPLPTKIAGVRMNRRVFLVGTVGGVVVVGAGSYLFWLKGLNGPETAAGAKKVVPLLGATEVPTATAQPTARPTPKPTPKPTQQPAVQPTQQPAPPPTQPAQQPTPVPAPTTGTLLYKYNGHSEVVNWVSWSPNNQRIASASADQTVQVWNPLNGGNVLRYTGHTAAVFAALWSPDGSKIASGSTDSTVHVWSAGSGSDINVYRGHTNVVGHLAWSPDGTRIASSSDDQTVQVWNATDGSNVLVYKGHVGSGVYGVFWSSDGRFISSAGIDGTVHVWNSSNGTDYYIYRGHSGSVVSVPWHPTQYRIASGGNDHTVQIWNATNGSNAFTYTGHSNVVFSVSWSPDGTRIASSGKDNTVQLWNAVDGKNRFVYTGHYGVSVNTVAWSPNGAYIASGGGGGGDSSVQVWVAG